ncbi:MAG: phosphatidylglycerophosphatase A [Candidatus Aureabacteria bacterium]|nr:phosphatidylglycerophosphatase A [Candidatus Auribacterota bacterium]
MKKKLILALATGFGLGWCPVFPGTIGSLPGFILVFFFSKTAWPSQIGFLIFLFLTGVWISGTALKWFHEKDPSPVTIDEIFSIPVTFFLIPLTPFTIGTGFILNRVLDIWKPFPAFQSQKLHKGWGIMTDDLISAIYSNLILHGIIYMIPK